MKPLPESKSITGSLMQCCPSDHLNLQWTRKQIYPEKIACCPCPNIAKRPSTKTCSTVKGDFFLTEFHLPATAAPLTLAELCRCDTGSASTRRCKSVLSCFAPRLPGEPKLLVFLGNFQNFGNFPKVAVIFATSPKIGNFHGKTQIIATLSLPVPFALI